MKNVRNINISDDYAWSYVCMYVCMCARNVCICRVISFLAILRCVYRMLRNPHDLEDLEDLEELLKETYLGNPSHSAPSIKNAP